MPTILTQRTAGGPMHELVHHPMARSYHAALKRHAAAARALSGADSAAQRRWESVRIRLLRLPEPWRSLVPQSWESELAEHAVLALIYSAMAIEAYANQVAEELIPFKELRDFGFCQGKFKPPAGWVSSPAWKWKLLFEQIGRTVEMTDPLLTGVAQVASDRNSLVHYQLSKSATMIVHKPPREENGMFIMWEAGAEPADVLESRVPNLFRAESATKAEGALEDLLAGWNAAAVQWQAKRPVPPP